MAKYSFWRVRSLEESNRENRRIIAGLIERIPELEAPSEARESSVREEAGEPGEGTGEFRERLPGLPGGRRMFRTS